MVTNTRCSKLVQFVVAYAAAFLLLRLIFWWLVESAELRDGRKAHLRRLERLGRVELIMLPFSAYVYHRLRAALLPLWYITLSQEDADHVYFSLPNSTTTPAVGEATLLRLSRRAAGPALLVFLVGAHSAYFMYYLEGVVPLSLAWFASLSLGVYAHLVVFLVMFGLLNLACRLGSLPKLLSKWLTPWQSKWLNRLCTDANWQTMLALAGALFVSAVSIWTYTSTRLVYVDVHFDVKGNGRPSWEGKKIALLSDVHMGSFVDSNWLRSAVQLTNSARPDVVAIVGDLFDGTVESLAVKLEPLRELRSLHGVFFVTGNHEYYMGRMDKWLSFLKSLGLRPLRNRNVKLNFGLCLAGTDDVSAQYTGVVGHKMDARRALNGCNESASLSVLLQHNPAAVDEIVKQASPNLVLAGHTHGGQFYVLAPVIWATFRYFHGLYKVNGETQVYVSAGVFCFAAPMKTLNGGSEITIITLKSK